MSRFLDSVAWQLCNNKLRYRKSQSAAIYTLVGTEPFIGGLQDI